MSIPSGVSTCTITAGKFFSPQGTDGSVSMQIFVNRPVIHDVTGWRMDTDSVSIAQESGMASASVPHVDQAGFLDANSVTATTGWFYTVKVTYSNGTSSKEVSKNWSPFVGQSTVDFEKIPDGPVSPAFTAPTTNVTSVNGQTGAVVVEGGGGVLAAQLGKQKGSVVQPWKPQPPIGAELWSLANFAVGASFNSSTLSPAVTADGNTKNSRTLVRLGNLANNDRCFRVAFDFDLATVNAGWATIALQLVDAGGNIISPTLRQIVVTRDSPKKTGHLDLDFQPTTPGDTFLEVRIDVYNNATAGTVSITNATVREVAGISRPLMVSKQFAGGAYPYVYWQQRQANAGPWKVAGLDFSDDGALAVAYSSITGFADDAPWSKDPADPAFLRATNDVDAGVGSQQETGTAYSLRIKNNDQILEVFNGSTWELRGNTHGGEFLRGSASYKVDRGSGFVAYTPVNGLEPVRRFQVSLPTEMRRSVDGTSAFANVDHTFTIYADGVIRCDRTTTFLADTQVRNLFEWMSSHATGTNYLGRIGSGLAPSASVDTAPGKTAATSGDAAWAVLFEATSGWAYGQAYDRDAVLARPLVGSVRTRLLRGDGLQKIYANVYWSGDSEAVTVPAGTVWTATHWAMTYVPQDTSQFHREIAQRAVGMAELKAVYPNT